MTVHTPAHRITLYTSRTMPQFGKLVIFVVCWVALASLACLNAGYLLWGTIVGASTTRDVPLALTILAIVVALLVLIVPTLSFLDFPIQGCDSCYFPDDVGNVLFPLATEQPEALNETETLSQPEAMGNVVTQARFSGRKGIGEAQINGALSALLVISPIVLITFPRDTSPTFAFVANLFALDERTLSLVFITMESVILLLLLTSEGIRAIQRRTTRRVFITSEGIRWGGQIIRWREIRGFYCRSLPSEASRMEEPPILYRVDGPHDSFMWQVPPDDAQRDRLAQFVYAFGMVPARDMTDLARELRAHGNSLPRLIAERRRAGEDVAALESLNAQWGGQGGRPRR